MALRRAISLGYNSVEDIALLKKGFALPARVAAAPNVLRLQSRLPQPAWPRSGHGAALLDRFGYEVGPDGFRTQPDGTPLILTMHTSRAPVGRLRDELWRAT